MNAKQALDWLFKALSAIAVFVASWTVSTLTEIRKEIVTQQTEMAVVREKIRVHDTIFLDVADRLKRIDDSTQSRLEEWRIWREWATKSLTRIEANLETLKCGEGKRRPDREP